MSEAYRRAGVDLEAAAGAVARIREAAGDATRPEVVEGIGGFAGLFALGDGRLLAAAADGVGTKLEIARAMGRLDTIGIDLVAMCANDVVCTGAEPLFFLDYIAVERLVPEEVAEVVAGIAQGCRLAGCALLGGETAEHPGAMLPDRLDLAGFCVGVVDEESLLRPGRVEEGDVLVGLLSSGLHANGFSLVRRVIQEAELRLDDPLDGARGTIGEALLEPTAIYVRAVRAAARTGAVHAAAHITGGGLPGNLPRALPEGMRARLDRAAWREPAVLDVLRRAGNLTDEDAAGAFNLGIGMVLAVSPQGAEDVRRAVGDAGVQAATIGRVLQGDGIVFEE